MSESRCERECESECESEYEYEYEFEFEFEYESESESESEDRGPSANAGGRSRVCLRDFCDVDVASSRAFYHAFEGRSTVQSG